MHDDTFHDEILFDRLVDGELSSTERQQLLGSLDDRPDGWRRCALRFLESQCWKESVQQYVREPMHRAVHESRSTILPAGTTSIDQTSIDKTDQRRVPWAAMAAGLLIAFTLGLVMRSDGPGGRAPIADNGISNPAAPIAQVVPPSAPESNATNTQDALTLFVRDEHGQTRPLRIPLVDAQSLDRQLGLQFQSGVPDNVRNRLQDRGFNVQSKRSYAPLWLEDGRPMFVPVEDTKIVPVSQNVY